MCLKNALLGPNCPDGRIVEALAIPWLEIVRLCQRDANAIYQLPWEKLEELVAGAYERAGYDEVILTPRSGDLGRDVIAIKRGVIQVRLLESVKAYKPGHLVTHTDVRALIGVMHMDNANKGVVTTTSDFAPKIATDRLIKPYIPGRLELINGCKLIERLTSLTNERDG